MKSAAAARTAQEQIRDSFATVVEEEFLSAAAISAQRPPTMADVDRCREHVTRALRALQELEAQLSLMGEDSRAFLEALGRRGSKS